MSVPIRRVHRGFETARNGSSCLSISSQPADDASRCSGRNPPVDGTTTSLIEDEVLEDPFRNPPEIAGIGSTISLRCRDPIVSDTRPVTPAPRPFNVNICRRITGWTTLTPSYERRGNDPQDTPDHDAGKHEDTCENNPPYPSPPGYRKSTGTSHFRQDEKSDERYDEQ